MRIISYRGPNTSGGVSSALGQIYESRTELTEWSYVLDSHLETWSKVGVKESICNIDNNLLRGHYNYCNNFLWPILHDLPQYAHYNEDDRISYSTFNYFVSLQLSTHGSQGSFVNDYQFAVLPSFLGTDQETIMFWHIPWPTHVHTDHVDALRDIALGMLQAKLIGFHTQEYLVNFVNFVVRYCPSFTADRNLATITHCDSMAQKLHVTRLIATPLGSNYEFWNNLSRSEHGSELVFPSRSLPYFLSVDRIDYTKGVKDRLVAIDHFFRMFPQRLEKVHFVQIGTRSRAGLSEFDDYWETCTRLAETINKRWSKGSWQPLIWIDQPVASNSLAKIYANAAAMLVNPWRDGLNLTAKEFIASRDIERNPGVLALSNGAGVWKEIGQHTVLLCPSDPVGMAISALKCLEMTRQEQQLRMLALKNSLRKNDLDNWCHLFFGAHISTNDVLPAKVLTSKSPASLVRPVKR